MKGKAQETDRMKGILEPKELEVVEHSTYQLDVSVREQGETVRETIIK